MKQPQHPPNLADLLQRYPLYLKWVGSTLFRPVDPQGRYPHWDELRYREMPSGLEREQYWAIMRTARAAAQIGSSFQDKSGQPFSYLEPAPVKRLLHKIDSAAHGNIGVSEPVITQENQSRYFVRSVIEEAFSSSFLEGAVTTRETAKEIIRRGKKPANKSEQMVFNNYKAIQFINENRDEALTPELVFKIHHLITQGTLERPEMAGKFRTASDDINVVDEETGEIVHAPPAASELDDRLEDLCKFANEDASEVDFMHPLIRAIILHFMLAYDHPFIDGNGRTARALFYWSALQSGYWMLEYTSISKVLINAPAKYARAFLHTETDGADLTYFLIHQLEVIDLALIDLEDYLRRKTDEFEKFRKALERANIRADLNHRQIQLLEDSVRHPGANYTIREHEKYHGVSYLTAREDLERLYKLKLYRKLKEGQKSIYIAERKLVESISK